LGFQAKSLSSSLSSHHLANIPLITIIHAFPSHPEHLPPFSFSLSLIPFVLLSSPCLHLNPFSLAMLVSRIHLSSTICMSALFYPNIHNEYCLSNFYFFPIHHHRCLLHHLIFHLSQYYSLSASPSHLIPHLGHSSIPIIHYCS